MAVELATSLEGQLGIEVSALSLSDAPTIERIAARVAQYLRPAAQADGPALSQSDLAEQVRLVAGRHASEISSEVVAEFTAEIEAAAAPIPRILGQTS